MILQLPNGRKYKKNAKMNGLIIYSKFWYFFLLTKFFENKNKKKYQNFDYIINPFILAFFLHFRPLGSWRIMKTNPQIRQFEDNRSPPPISSKKPAPHYQKRKEKSFSLNLLDRANFIEWHFEKNCFSKFLWTTSIPLVYLIKILLEGNYHPNYSVFFFHTIIT